MSLNKVKVTGSDILPAHIMKFTPDGETLVSATREGSIQLYQIVDSQPFLTHTFFTDPGSYIHTVGPFDYGPFCVVCVVICL